MKSNKGEIKMIRRKVIFKDTLTGKLFVSPELNGCKEEYKERKLCSDGCIKSWNEMLEDFESVKTLQEFEEVSEKVQNYYFTPFGVEILPIKEITSIQEVKSDYIYLVEDGHVKIL